jgi:hypothetical protein
MGKAVWIIGGGLGVVGVGLLAAALYALGSTLAFRADAVSLPGTVVDLTAGKPVVAFVDANGRSRQIIGSVSSDPPAYDVGEQVTVRHPPDHPELARIDSWSENWFLATLFGGMGGISTSVGSAIVVREVRKRRLLAWLRQFGTRIDAKFTGAVREPGTRANDEPAWRLTAQWQDPAAGLLHTFESDLVFYDPTEFVQRETLHVWIDPRNPRRYAIDTSFLPMHAEG